MIGVKDAVKVSTGFVKELYPDAKDIRLEEVEMVPSQWSVVLSFKTGELSSSLASIVGEQRLFKNVIVDSENGLPTALRFWSNG